MNPGTTISLGIVAAATPFNGDGTAVGSDEATIRAKRMISPNLLLYNLCSPPQKSLCRNSAMP